MPEIRANNRFNILTELRARPPLTTVRYHISSESCFYSDEMEMSVGAMHIQRKLNRGRWIHWNVQLLVLPLKHLTIRLLQRSRDDLSISR